MAHRASRPDLGGASPADRLSCAIAHAAHYLPAQAPLEVFVHHNTLHAYQHLPFHDAVAAAGARTGAAAYLSTDEYRKALRAGRIRHEDLDDVIASSRIELPTGAIEGLPGPRTLARTVLLHDVRAVSRAELEWELAEHEADHRFAPHVSDVSRARIVTETADWLRAELARIGPAGDVLDVAAWIVGSSHDDRAASDVRARLRESLGIELAREPLLRAMEERLEHVSVSALWTACARLAGSLPVSAARRTSPHEPRFLRELFLSRGADDPCDLVDPVLIPACASFLDRGQSHWSMPDRDRGFFEAWSRMQTSGRAVRPAWLSDLGKRLRAWRAEGKSATDVALALLEELGIADEELEDFVEHTLLKLPGWAGMFHQLEAAPGPIGRSRAAVRLLDFFAVRLVLDAQAARDLARRVGHRGPLSELRAHLRAMPRLGARDERSAAAASRRRDDEPGVEASVWPLFRLAQHAGVSAPVLWRAGARGAELLQGVLRALDEPTRLRLWHEAYERRYRDELLHAIAANVARARSGEEEQRDRRARGRARARRRFQIVCCLDDREESLRRHFEELSEEHETFGAAGFFNLAIAYQGIDDPSTFPLCPVVVQPQHRIAEQPAAEHVHLAEARRRWRKRLGWLEARFDRASRTMLFGPLVTALAGAVTALPLLVEVFAPRFAARVRRAATRRLLPELRTELTVPRTEGDGEAGTRALVDGFAVDEKASRVAGLLENMGLTRDFAPIVAIIGHDSTSVNNFHFAAYSCGACGGRSGGPNARLFARMANRPEVRALLRERGIDIPDDTIFVGAIHDTCADTLRFYDVESVPEEHAPRLEALQRELSRALARNAHERCRKFESAPRDPSFELAHEHVESRSVDLSQPRPELGHATNAGCVVGRRALTEGLFLDRRVFLASYDPSTDPGGEILERLLLAVGPVCAGINLEYFFSTVDPERYGAGTKLPHNVTALVGVMNGASSDLRTGLPRQMIEIHEPVRLQLVVERDEATVRAIIERQPVLRELIGNEWVRLSLCDPRTGTLSVLGPGGEITPWEPPEHSLSRVRSSVEWYRGHTGFVPPARVEPVRAGQESAGA